MPPVVLVARDHTLDIALQSESGIILIIVAIAVGLLFVVTAIVIHGSGFFGTMRRYLRLPGRAAKEPELEKSEPAKPPSLRIASASSMSKSISTPQFRETPKLSNSHRISANFFTLRKHPTTSPQAADIYASTNETPRRPTLETPHTASSPPLASPPGVVPPHIAEWMKVADTVVGRHPNSRPLHVRVATQAEIDLISGHVHIPWANKNQGRSPMIPAKIAQSIISFVPPPPMAKPLQLKDVSNKRRSKITVYVDNVVKSSSKPSKGKKVHRHRGKENLPPSSLPLVHVHSGRRY